MSRTKSKCEHYTPMIYEQVWNICMSIRKSNPKKHKALFKDLMKLEEDKYYPKKKGKKT